MEAKGRTISCTPSVTLAWWQPRHVVPSENGKFMAFEAGEEIESQLESWSI
jgi:hypothetical protein